MQARQILDRGPVELLEAVVISRRAHDTGVQQAVQREVVHELTFAAELRRQIHARLPRANPSVVRRIFLWSELRDRQRKRFPTLQLRVCQRSVRAG
jgi:hypothetical protein